MDIDEAWDAFQKSRSIKKTSIAEKLDTIAAQLNEIQTDSARTAELVPKILGDDAAIEASNAQAPPMDPSMMGGMGGAPPMGDPTGGAVPGAEEMGPDGMDLGTGDGMTEDTEMPPTEEEVPEEPLEEGAPAPEPEEDVGEPMDMGEQVPEEPPMEEPVPEEPMIDGGADAGGTIPALTNMLHEKVDEGNMADVKALADAIEQLGGGMGAPPMDMEMAPDAGAAPIPMDAGGTEPIKLSAMDDSGVSDIQPNSAPITESADESNESVVEQIMDILSEAQAEVAEVMTGDETPKEPAGETEVEIEIEPEEETEEGAEDAPKAELSEEGEGPFEDSADACGDGQPAAQIGMESKKASARKSVDELSFREVMEARMRGEDLIAEHVQKSAGETNGYNEFDPWMIARRADMFKKSETVADEVADPKTEMSGKHDGTDSTTIADDIKEPSNHLKGSAPGGDMIDDVDEEKGTSDHSVKGGELLEDVDEKKGTSDHGVGDEDLLDDVDEEKSKSEGKVGGGDLLDDVKPARKTAADTGVPVMSIREMMAIKKTNGFAVSRPDNIATVGGEFERPSLGKLKKSTTPEPVKMGHGVDPHKVVESDWAEYNLYKAQFGL